MAISEQEASSARQILREYQSQQADVRENNVEAFTEATGLDVNPRTANALWKAGYRSIEQLRSVPYWRFLEIPGFGQKSIRDLIYEASRVGVELDSTPPMKAIYSRRRYSEPTTIPARWEIALTLRSQGLRWVDVAEQLGVSKERARQMATKCERRRKRLAIVSDPN